MIHEKFLCFNLKVRRGLLLHGCLCSPSDEDEQDCKNFQSQQAVGEATIVDIATIAADHLQCADIDSGWLVQSPESLTVINRLFIGRLSSM